MFNSSQIVSNGSQLSAETLAPPRSTTHDTIFMLGDQSWPSCRRTGSITILSVLIKSNTDVGGAHYCARSLKNMEDAYSQIPPIELYRGQAMHCALFCTIKYDTDLLATYLHVYL
jgi:hypothetical protein